MTARVFLIGLFVLAAGFGFLGFQSPAGADSGEIEKFVKARIDIGEWMGDYMKGLRYDEKGMEDIGKMEQEINARVAEILGSHGLTIEDYEKRAPGVFQDEEAVSQFLESRPDLKEKYLSLPMHGMRGGPPGGHP